jgi:hypothetical protein
MRLAIGRMGSGRYKALREVGMSHEEAAQHVQGDGTDMSARLAFVVGPPRSGSTLLMRILNATSQVYSRYEPHLFPALAHLGFWDAVEKAPYDQLQAQQAIRAFVQDMPGGEQDYWDACKAYLDVLYGRMLTTCPNNERYFLDKTPANSLVLPFMAKVYPNAKFIILTRHPAAIFASYANSFFDGDFQAAVDFNPILSRYIPVMARFLREKPINHLHVQYENLVTDPEGQLQRISEFLEIPYEPDAVNYKKKTVAGEGLGDPVGVEAHSRPVTTSIHKWAPELAADPDKFNVVADQLAQLPDEDLACFGYPKSTLWAPMEEADPKAWVPAKKKWDRFQRQRKILVWLRKDIHNRWHGPLVRKIRFICDVLLRG